jgi:hypothetical protein
MDNNTIKNNQNKNNENFKITGDWATQSKQLKEQYKQLTDADLKFEQGKESDLISRLETKLGKKREEVIDIIKKSQTKEVETTIK